MKFTVVGAGMAGLLAAAMLRTDCERLIEAQESLPNNHAALLRFRSSVVGDTLNIPFRKVQVMKSILSMGNPLADMMAYSKKVTGTAGLRSSISAKGEIEDRYIAPPDLIARMAARVSAPMEFSKKFTPKVPPAEWVISTIPMPVMMEMLDYPSKPEFRSVMGGVISIKLENVDVCATLYYPSPEYVRYRASITRDELIIEYAFPGDREKAEKLFANLTRKPVQVRDEIYSVLEDMGIPNVPTLGKPKVHTQSYGKILPIDEATRKHFIMWATDNFNVYSLGRFATWRPGLLLDDIVEDVRVIQRVAENGSYDHRKQANA